MRMKYIAAASVAACTALALTGCAAADTDTADADGSSPTFTVVASTDVYGDIAASIGGDEVQVVSIIDSTGADPHDYEATAKDRLTVTDADLLITNGGGYDAFMDTLIGDTDTTRIIASEFAADFPHGDEAHGDEAHEHEGDSHDGEEHEHGEHEGHEHIEGFNEHVWYEPAVIEAVAAQLASDLSAALPASADAFEQNLAAFTVDIDGVEASLASIGADHPDAGVLVTEPVPLRLTDAAGLRNLTPEAFSEAVEEGTDVAPATLQETLSIVDGGDVRVLIVNAQTGGPETDAVIGAAEKQGIPVIEFAETLPEDADGYIDWMQQNVAKLADALG